MSDARDLNKDGHVSLAEKVKDKLHLGHKNKDAEYTATHHATTTATHHTTPIVGASGHHTTPVVGTMPVGGAMPVAGAMPIVGAMPIAGAMPLATSAMPLASTAGARDLNHDGHISTTERLATAGSHSSAFNSGLHDSRDLNRDGHVSTSEKLAAGSLHSSSGLHDSRDLNRDGHVSTSEKLAAGSLHSSSGFHDSRDLNRDGHVSTSEKLASSHMGANFQNDEARLRLHEEQLAISKREVGAGEVDIHKRVQEEHVQQTIPVRREEVTVERRALHGVAEPGARIAAQDEVVRVPLYREEIITEKRLVPTEEVIVRKKEIIDQQTVGATLRSEYVETSQTGMSHQAGFQQGSAYSNTGAFDARDTNRDGHVSMGEKLKGGNATAFGADRRDLNGDGHVSMGEKLKTADANGDGRVSTGEKIRAARG